MSDYIEREAAQSAVWEEDNQTDMILAIGSLPAADVAPVRHGRWISTGALSCKCSECHHLELKTRALEYTYCPACGALVDRKEDEHEAG